MSKAINLSKQKFRRFFSVETKYQSKVFLFISNEVIIRMDREREGRIVGKEKQDRDRKSEKYLVSNN